MSGTAETIQYQPQGTCCKLMQVTIQDNQIVSTEFFGGCNGNLQGISKLVEGMDIDNVIDRLQGIPCGAKPTSCPDQLAQCLTLYKKSKQTATSPN